MNEILPPAWKFKSFYTWAEFAQNTLFYGLDNILDEIIPVVVNEIGNKKSNWDRIQMLDALDFALQAIGLPCLVGLFAGRGI